MSSSRSPASCEIRMKLGAFCTASLPAFFGHTHFDSVVFAQTSDRPPKIDTPPPRSTQVAPDYKGALWVSGDSEFMTDKVGQAIAIAKDRFNSMLRRFSSDDGGCEPTATNRKFNRRASFWFMQALQHVLTILTGAGLEQFATSASPRCRAHATGAAKKKSLVQLWDILEQQGAGAKTLIVAADQCSVGMTALTYMDRVLNLRVEAMWDPFHRYWNNEKLGISHAKWWDVVLLFACPFNINFGPFSGAGWLNQLQGCLREYASSIGNSDDPLFRRFLPAIAKDRKEEHLLGDERWVAERWASIEAGDAFATKGPKMAFCRWASFYDCFVHFDASYHSRLLGMVCWGLNEGILKQDMESLALRIEGLYRATPNPDSRSPMHDVAHQVKDIRSKGNNQLHIALLILLIPDLQKKGRILVTLMEAARSWHSLSVRHMRNPALCQD